MILAHKAKINSESSALYSKPNLQTALARFVLFLYQCSSIREVKIKPHVDCSSISLFRNKGFMLDEMT